MDRSWADRLEYIGIAVEEPGYHVWGSSPIIGPEGNTNLFVARWPTSAPFTPGWHTHCEIALYMSEKPEGPFTFKEIVLSGTEEDSWDRLAPHNPTIHKVGTQYALLYIANTGEGFPASQRIGMVVSKNIDGPWKKVGKDGLILSPPDNPSVWCHGSTVGVNNPALLSRPDGRFFLYFKAMRKGNIRRMGVAIAENLEGPYVFHDKPLTNNRTTIEDGYAFIEDRRTYLLTTDNHNGAGLLWMSDDGITFHDPVVGFDRMEQYIPEDIVKAATNCRDKKFERPQVLIQNGHPAYLYMPSGVNIRGGNGSCSYVFRINK